MNTQKKLKRGLRELSPLFRKSSEASSGSAVAEPASSEVFKLGATVSKTQQRPLFVSVFSCDDMGGDSFLLGSYLTSKLSGKGKSCLVLSVAENSQGEKKEVMSVRGPVKHVTLDWKVLSEVWDKPTAFKTQANSSFDPITFLDFDLMKVPEPNKMISVLDKCILLVQPTFESLRECYRMIKMTRVFNPTLEYFLIYDGPHSDARSTIIFEQLSGMVAKRLGVDLVWLGCLEKMEHDTQTGSELALEHLFLNSTDKAVQSVEKKALEALLVRTCLEISRGGQS